MQSPWNRLKRQGHRLLAGTLRCAQCSRPVGDVVGYADCDLDDARFVSLENGLLPAFRNGRLCCSACGGSLLVDEVSTLGRNVPLDEVGGMPFAEVIARARSSDTTAVA